MTQKPLNSTNLNSLLSKYSSYTLDQLSNLSWEAGIDEAGRGPVIGPMVYAICLWPEEFRLELSGLGFNDSKKLSEAQREKVVYYRDKLWIIELWDNIENY